MTEEPSWEQTNERFVAAALEWLRVRLAAFAEGASRDQSDAAYAALAEAELAEPPPVAAVLERRLGLTRFDRDVLLLCAAVELDPSIPALCASAHGDPRMTYPTFALALSMLDDPSWDALSPLGALRYWRLIEITQPPGQPLTTSTLRADERIVSYLKGLNYLDDRLEPLLTSVGLPERPDPPSQTVAAEAISRRWAGAESDDTRVVQLVGPDVAKKRLVAARAAQELGRSLTRCLRSSFPRTPPSSRTSHGCGSARASSRRSRSTSTPRSSTGRRRRGGAGGIARFLARCNGIACLGTREVWTALAHAYAPIEVERPSDGEQRDAWRSLSRPRSTESVASMLAGQFNLDLPAIDAIARDRARRAAASALTTHLGRAVSSVTRPRLDALAQRLEPQGDLGRPRPAASRSSNCCTRSRARSAHRSKVYERVGLRASA